MGTFLDFLTTSSEKVGNIPKEIQEYRGAAENLNAKRMQNKATKGMMDYFAGDPTTQFIAMHPEASVAMINAAKLPLIKQQLKKAISQQLQGVANPDDPMQQQIVNNVLPEQPPIQGNNNNLPASDINDPTLEEGASVVDLNEQPGEDEALATTDISTPVSSRKGMITDVSSKVRESNQKSTDLLQEAQKAKGFEALGLPYTDENGNLVTSDSLEKQASNYKDNADRELKLASLNFETNPEQITLTNNIENDRKILPELRDSSIMASSTINNLKEVRNTVTENGINAGTLSPIKEKLGGLASSLGFNSDDIEALKTAGDLNSINKILTSATLGAANTAFSGQRISNLDLTTVNKTIPDINTNTTEGFLKLVDLVTAIQERNIDYSKMAQQWATKYGATGQPNEKGQFLDEVWGKYMKNHPLSKTLKKNGDSDVPQFDSPDSEDFKKLPSGAQFKDHLGNIRTKN